MVEKEFAIITQEGQFVMRRSGKRIAPVTFSVSVRQEDIAILGPLTQRRYKNLCESLSIDPLQHAIEEIETHIIDGYIKYPA